VRQPVPRVPACARRWRSRPGDPPADPRLGRALPPRRVQQNNGVVGRPIVQLGVTAQSFVSWGKSDLGRRPWVCDRDPHRRIVPTAAQGCQPLAGSAVTCGCDGGRGGRRSNPASGVRRPRNAGTPNRHRRRRCNRDQSRNKRSSSTYITPCRKGRRDTWREGKHGARCWRNLKRSKQARITMLPRSDAFRAMGR
jgi:hypothetical protein